MRKNLLFLLPVIVLASCKSVWSADAKQKFYEGCTEEAIKAGDTPEKAKAYCDCVFGKMEKKYSNEEDALEHIDQLAKDTDLIKCKEEVLNAPASK